LLSDSGELVESGVVVVLFSVADVSPVAACPPDGDDGDSVGVFCESNSIGPRTSG
jgi:hypothetical protein